MNTFLFFALCFQACFIQTVWSQYNLFGPGLSGGANPGMLGYKGPTGPITAGSRFPNDLNLGVANARSPAPPPAMFGGTGEGGVSVAGELPVAGTTVINGQVPMSGAVKFNGNLPASGVVTITGTCSCGCNSPIVY